MISWKSQHQSLHALHQKAHVITLYQLVITQVSSTPFHRHHSSSSRSLWHLVLIDISKLHLVSVTRMHVLTVLQESSISLIWRWHSLHRKTYLQLSRMYFLQSLQSTAYTRALQQLHSYVSHILRLWISMVQTSQIFVSTLFFRTLQMLWLIADLAHSRAM